MNKVIKIGGSILSDSNEFINSFNSIKKQDNTPSVIVVSALSKSTRILHKIAYYALDGKLDFAIGTTNTLFDFYSDFAKEIGIPDSILADLEAALTQIKLNIFNLLEGVSITRELTRRTIDAIISRGEAVTIEIVRAYCQKIGLAIRCIDAADLITTDSDFGAAKPLIGRSVEQIVRTLAPILASGTSVVTQGFVAQDANGEITTMGIESSNLTATLIAHALRCDRLEIVTDVDGIRSADPKKVSTTIPIEKLSYRQAFSAANNGLKLVYPDMIALAEESNIEIVFRSTKENGEQTIVAGATGSALPMIVEKSNVELFIADFDSFADYSHAFSAITKFETKKNRIAFCEFNPDHATIAIPNDGSRKMKSELMTFCRHIDDRSIITILNIMPAKCSLVFDVLSRAEIDFLKYSESTIIVITESFAAQGIINMLHTCLYPLRQP